MNKNLKPKFKLFLAYMMVTTILVIVLASLTEIASEMPTFGPEDNEKTVRLAKETVIIIMLPENPSTGYAWNQNIDGKIAQIIEDKFIPSDNSLLGSGGTRLLKLKVVGTGEIKLEYMRAWENDPLETFNLMIII